MNDINYLSRANNLISNFKQADKNQKTDILKQLKLQMLHFATLPPSNQKMNVEEFYLARDILELEMENYIILNDGKNFELAYLKIKQFYFDYK